MAEDRTEPRAKALKGGKIVFNRSSVIDCTIRDISKHGARLSVDGAPSLPASFELVYSDQLHQHRRSCRVVWRSLNGLGVVFD